MSEIYQSTLIKKDGKLKHVNSGKEVIYKEFVSSLPEGHKVDLYIEASAVDHSIGQLAKVHKCIRTLASSNGNTFLEMKKDIKRRCGMLIEAHGTEIEVSFSRISKDDLNLAIQACIELGDELGINLR